MADATETGAPNEGVVTETPTETPAVKKQRAPRRSKAEIDAAAAAKSPKGRQKRTARQDAAPMSAETGASVTTKKTLVKSPATAKSVSKANAPIAPMTAGDEMAELFQLEEENKKLRQALAEKLRAENADLRKRLGV